MCKKLIYLFLWVAVLFMSAPASAVLDDWRAAAAPASPTFLATNIADGVYNIGTYGGEQTYEFVVKSNPAETEPSMCLIGRRDFGDTQAGLKFDQWENTGEYGATIFGVVDLYFGVPNNPGVDTHLAFVSSVGASTTKLYVNGEYKASVDRAISLSGDVGIGYGAQDAASRGSASFDNFDGVIYGVAIYNVALSDSQIKARSDAFFAPAPVDPGAESLVAHYAFENDASDSSVNALHGTLMGDPAFAAGTSGMALDLDGAGDFVDCGGNAQFSFTNAMTVSTWVNIRSVTTAWMAMVAKGENAWRLGVNNQTTGIHYAFTGSARSYQAANTSIQLPFNEWHHVAATYDVSVGALVYIDGVLDASNPDTGGIETNGMPLLLGDNPEATGRFFDGLLDEVTIYGRALSAGEILHLAGHRAYAYDGDAAVAGPANSNDSLDGTWDHNNGSDTWDDSGIGQGAPGGASALVEDGVTFLRIQDPGDPRDYAMPDPSNRKVYFTHTTGLGLDGVRLEVRARIATSAPLDDQHPDGGAGITPWPAEGIGYHIRDDGKGMFGIAQDGLGIISFSLAQPGEAGFENVATDVLVMNSHVGAQPSGDVDTGAAATAVNMMAVDDVTQWNTFVIDIAAGGTGTHVVSISANGQPAQSFDVTVGTGLEAGKGSYIAVGSSGTGPLTAFDVDYISVRKPVPAPEPEEPAIVNLLANGGFEDGVLEPWSTYGTVTTEVVRQLVGAAVPEGPIEGNYCLHVVVPAAGANFWDMGLQHTGHVFEANKEYTLSVWLKCKEGTLDINLKPELGADPWTGYGDQVVTITDQWAQYSIKTPVFGQDTSPGSITLHIGFAAAEFWVDGAQWYESAYFPPVEPPPGGPVNELTNGGFEEGPSMPLDTWAPGTWNVYGDHTIEVVSELTGAAVPEAPVEGAYCLHVTVPQAGANFWDVGLQNAPHTFKQGKKYTLSAWFKSKSGTLNVNMKPELAADPWTGFGERQITMTDQWAEYSTTTPVFAQDTSPGSLTFHIAFAPGDFWMDNVRWYEGDYVAP